MKRKTYEIRLNGKAVAKKHAWNSAIREIGKVVKNALSEGQEARQISRTFQELDKWTKKGGLFIWEVSNGDQWKVEIELIDA